jgi:glycerol uptake facilitator-like aquaporin
MFDKKSFIPAILVVILLALIMPIICMEYVSAKYYSWFMRVSPILNAFIGLLVYNFLREYYDMFD